MAIESKDKLDSNWITKADNDLAVVEIGLYSDKLLGDVLCFHCQQAVEKYL